MVEEGTNLNNSVMSRILGERWKQLSEEEKKTWKRTADKLKKEHAKMYPTYKYKPKKRNSSSNSTSSTGSLMPLSPSSSVSVSPQERISEQLDEAATVLDDHDGNSNSGFDERANTPDSLGSLEDLDFLGVDAMDDNDMQNIIEEVMTMENFNNENIPQNHVNNANPGKLLPKITQAMLAPKRQNANSPVKIQFNEIHSYQVTGNDPNGIPKLKVVLPTGMGKKLKKVKSIKANILKPKTTIYKKSVVPSEVTALAPASATEFYEPPPSKRIKQDTDTVATNPEKGEKLRNSCGDIQTKEEHENTKNTKEDFVTDCKEEIKVKSEESPGKSLFDTEEEPPSVDNPRLFTDLVQHEAAFIGDIERTFDVFEKIENKSKQKEADEKHLEFMKRLDTWGIPTTDPQYPFTGFYGENSNIEEEELGVPEDWKDEALFSELDIRCKTESVFFNCWLPKFALKVRRDPYRNLLRTINKKDPEFNIVW